MDWTIVSNAEDALGRIHTLAYLLIERYEVDAGEAGRRMSAEVELNDLRDLTLAELRTELIEPSLDLSYAKFQNDVYVRRYLGELLAAFDQASATTEKAEQGGGADAEPAV